MAPFKYYFALFGQRPRRAGQCDMCVVLSFGQERVQSAYSLPSLLHTCVYMEKHNTQRH